MRVASRKFCEVAYRSMSGKEARDTTTTQKVRLDMYFHFAHTCNELSIAIAHHGRFLDDIYVSGRSIMMIIIKYLEGDGL